MESDLRVELERLRRENEALRQQLAPALKHIEALEKRIAELEALLAQATRASRRQAAPFGRKKRKSKPKKPGRKKGHREAHRERPQHVDQTLYASPLHSCPHCEAPVNQLKTLENYQTEIPPIEPEVTRFVFQSGWCECCQKRVWSLHPEQSSAATGAAAHHLGPRLRAFAADLKCRLGVPFRKITDILEQSFGIRVSPGALALSNHRLAHQAQATWDAMMEQLAAEALVHADETGWRVDGHSAWLMVVCSRRWTIYLISPHRQASVVAEVLGEDFPGLLMRDGYASYDARLDYRMLRCLRHLQHNAQDLPSSTPSESLSGRELFLLWLDGVFFLKQRVGELSQKAYAQEAAQLIECFDQWFLDGDWSAPHQEFLDRLGQLREQILPIVERRELPATNNLAERQIRPIVVHRKIAAGNKTELGAVTLSILASLSATCRQQAVHFARVVAQILRAPPDQPVEFWRFCDREPSPT